MKVELRADVAAYISQMAQAATATEKVAKNADQAGKSTEAMGKTAAKAGKEQADAAKNVAEQSEKSKRTLKDVSTGLLGVGAAAAVTFGLMVKGSAGFEAQMSAVKATGADAAQNIDGLREAAMKAGRQFGQFSGVDAAQGIEQLAKAGVDASEILGGALTGALSLAAAGEMAVGDAAEVTAKTLAQFQLEGKDAAHVADLLAAGAGKAVGDVKDFGFALAMAGTVANQYGVSVEETVGTLALFAQNALLGSDAGTSMKQMLLQLAQPTGKAQAALDQYNIAAYDAQGNFVGMADLAGQLQQKLGHLSQEQQNAALKTIFGADAIRAAAILMREGAEGVEEWTKAVDDQGYAAMVAATKMDNLKGDLRGLSGAWENLTISMGSKADSPLRSATQGLAGFVDALASAPPWMHEIAMGGIAVTAAVGLVGGGLMKGAIAANEARTAFKTLATDMPKTAAAMKGVGLAAVGLIATLALIKGVEAYTFRPMTQGLTESTTAMLAAAQELDRIGGSLTDSLDGFFVRESDSIFGGKQFVSGVESVTDAFQRLNPAMKSSGQQFNDFMSRAVRGVTFGQIGSEVSALEKQFGEMDKALAGMGASGATGQAGKAFSLIRTEAEKAGTSLDQLLQLFPEYKKALQDQANALEAQGTGFSAASLTAQDYADWMGGKIPPAVTAAANAAKAAGKPVKDLANVTDEATKAAAANVDRMRDMADAHLAMAGSSIGTERALIRARKELEESNKTLQSAKKGSDEYKTAQLDKQEAILSVVSAWIKERDVMEKAGAGSDAVAGKQAKVISELRGMQKALGLTDAQFQALLKTYGLVPEIIETKVSTPGAQLSQDQIASLGQKIKNLPKDTQARIMTVANSQGYQDALRMLDNINGKTATTYIRTVYSSEGTPMAPKGANQQQARAYGGPVFGPGGPRADLIPAMLSNGEFVHQTEAHQYYGSSLMWALNNRAIPRDYFKPLGFAGGGSPSSVSMPAMPMPNWNPSPQSYTQTVVVQQGGTFSLAGGRLELSNGYAYIHDIALEVVEDHAAMTQRTGGR